MREGPSIAEVASLIGDPARANMLGALMTGRALTAGELAREAGITAQTASGHLAKLTGAGLLLVAAQGRHRYFRLSGPDIAQVLEGLMGIAARTGRLRTRTGPRDPEMRRSRVCYDHMAGEWAVRLFEGFVADGRLAAGSVVALTAAGRAFFLAEGIDVNGLEQSRRPLCRACLDWSERRFHLGGALGKAVLDLALARGWVRRSPAGRTLAVTPPGHLAFQAWLGEARDASLMPAGLDRAAGPGAARA